MFVIACEATSPGVLNHATRMAVTLIWAMSEHLDTRLYESTQVLLGLGIRG
jgi:hypothetical protein